MNRKHFRDSIDRELEGLMFSEEARQKVRDGIGKPRGRLRAFLETEIRIPVRPFAAAVLIAFALTVYAAAGLARVTPEDMQKSRITVVRSDDGRIVK